MPQFTYTGVNTAGKKMTGSSEASSQNLLISKLKEEGIFVIRAEDKADVVKRKEIGGMRKIGIKDIAIFCRQFSTLINAGITAVMSLDILYQQTEKKALRKSIGQVYEAVQKGELMSEAFRKQGEIYPELFINMVMTGESGGNLDSVLLSMADHYEKENKLNNKIKGALVYPIILTILSVAIVTFLLTVVMPTFTGMIISGGAEIPAPTRILLAISDFLVNYWYIAIGIITLIVIGIRGFKRSEKGKLWWDTNKMKLPVIGKSLRMIYSARFARTLSTLLSSGIQMLLGIEITARVINNQLIHDKLNIMIEDIRKGSSLSVSLRKTNEFPPMIYNMISVGEESGLLDDILAKTAAFYDEESESAIQRIVGLIEPLMIVVMGFMIGFIVISMFLPMITMIETVG